METFDVIVVGTGGVGSAAAWHLARRGVRVLALDRFGPPHDRGSSHGQSRVIRQAYFEHPDYVPLLRESYRLWHELESRSGKRLYHPTGLIQLGPADGKVVPGVLRAAEQYEIAVEQLTAREVATRWPALAIPEPLVGVFEAGAGYLLVEQCVRAHIEAARADGADLRFDVEVQDWSADDNCVEVQTSDGKFSASRLVVCGGAWAGQLMADLGLPLVVKRKSLFWWATRDDRYNVESGFPVFLYELPDGIFYGFPRIDSRGVKCAEHSGGQDILDPLTVDRSVLDDERNKVAAFLKGHLPGVTTEMTDHTVCLYTLTPDEFFVVDHHPRHANVVFAAGLSGHGFKFTPVLGKVLADLVLDGETELPIGFLSVGRFGS
jgi:sarcosine oxidase